MDNRTVHLVLSRGKYQATITSFTQSIISFIGTICSFETVFILFLFAGLYKADPRFSWIPVDLTFIFMAWNMLIGIHILMRQRLKIQVDAGSLLLLYVCFATYMVASLWWSLGHSYGQTKAINMLIIVSWIMIACTLIIAQGQERMRKFLIMLSLFSFWIAIESHIAYLHTKKDWAVNVMNGSYLGVGRVVGAGALVVLGYALFARPKLWMKALAIGLYGYLIYVLLLIGGRGPLISTVIATLLPLLFSIRFVASRLKLRGFVFTILIILIIGGLFIGYLVMSDVSTQTVDRMLLLFSENEDMGKSANTRAMYYGDSLHFWTQSPWLGSGLGSFPVLYGHPGTMRLYPHNLFLEVLVELGIVGVVILCVLLLAAFRYCFPVRSFITNPYKFILVMLVVNTFINSQVTGDLSDNRFFFAVLGMLPFLHHGLNQSGGGDSGGS